MTVKYLMTVKSPEVWDMASFQADRLLNIVPKDWWKAHSQVRRKLNKSTSAELHTAHLFKSHLARLAILLSTHEFACEQEARLMITINLQNTFFRCEYIDS